MGRKVTMGRIALLPWGRKGFHSNKEWWTRTMWALEATASANDRLFGYGTAMLTMLAQSSDASKEEKGLLDAVWATAGTQMQDAAISRLFAERSAPIGPGVCGPLPVPHEGTTSLYREVLAARLKIVLDEQLGRGTSPLVHKLADLQIQLPA